MKTILIYGTGSYVLGNRHVKAVILPSILNFLISNQIKSKLVFIKKSNTNYSEIDKKIKSILSSFKIKITYEIFSLDIMKNNEILNLYKKENIFCSIISTPDNDHYNIAIDCFKNKIDIIVVKPLVLNSKQNEKLIKLSKKNNCVGFVDYHKRFDRQSKLIKEYNLNNIKSLYLIDINYSQKKIVSTELFNWVSKSNILNYLGSHYIDFVYHTSNYKPKSVMAIGTKKYLIKKKINTYDSIICLIKWVRGKDQFILNLKVNWIDPKNESSMSDQRVVMYYTNSKILSDQKNRGFYISTDNNNFESINPDFNQVYSNKKNSRLSYEGYGYESIFTFLTLINQKANKKQINYKEYSNIEHSMIVSKVLEASQRSLNNKSKWIEID